MWALFCIYCLFFQYNNHEIFVFIWVEFIVECQLKVGSGVGLYQIIGLVILA